MPARRVCIIPYLTLLYLTKFVQKWKCLCTYMLLLTFVKPATYKCVFLWNHCSCKTGQILWSSCHCAPSTFVVSRNHPVQCTVSNPNLTFWIAKSRPLQYCSSTIIFLCSSKEPSGSSAIKSYTSIRPTSRGLGKEHTHCVLALLCTGCALHFGQRLDNLVTLGFLSSYKYG